MTWRHPAHRTKATQLSRAALACMLAFALGACSSSEKAEEPNIFPANYKQEIIDTMLRRVFEDPANVRDAAISEPVLGPAGRETRYSVCVRANSRNANRQYTGVKERIGYFYGGRLNQLIDADKGQCAKAVYKPFPELEKLCLAKACD